MLMRSIGILIFVFSLFACMCRGQNTAEKELNVGGPCEDCEALMDYKLLGLTPRSVDTLEGFVENNPRIKISGTVYKSDKVTPADNIILYVYHTNRKGIYEPSKNPIGWEYRHGKYRGWLKTGANGKYTFYTFRPAAYPNGQEPEHIHLYVKEPGYSPYYIDNFTFSDDITLTKSEKKTFENRGGSGVLNIKQGDGLLTGERDIVLGLNVLDYPK